MYLWLRITRKDIKLELVKNIIINLSVILLACINLANEYLTLFLNKKQLLFSINDMLA